MAERKLPYIQFWVDDWRADACIKGCGPAARGVWFEMLLVMHQSPERGFFLSESGQPMTNEMFARLTGYTTDEISVTRALLERDMVYSIDERGIAFNRKMIREESIKKAARERQSRKRQKIKRTRNVTRDVTPHVTVDVTPDVTDIVPESQSPIVLDSKRRIIAEDKPPRTRKLNPIRDPIWDALAKQFFPNGVPPGKESLIGKCVTDLVAMKAVASDVAVRAINYTSQIPDCVLTMLALVNNWEVCREAKSNRDVGRVRTNPSRYASLTARAHAEARAFAERGSAAASSQQTFPVSDTEPGKDTDDAA